MAYEVGEAYRYIDQAFGLNSVFQLVLLHGFRSYSIAFPLRHRLMSKSEYLYLFAQIDGAYFFVFTKRGIGGGAVVSPKIF